MSMKFLQQQIVDELEVFQVPLADRIFVPEKAAEICQQHFASDAFDFVNDLVAYRMNCGVGEEKPLTQDFLDSFERARLNRESAGGNRKKNQYSGQTPSTRTPSSSRSFKARKPPVAPTPVFLDYGLTDCEETVMRNDQVDDGDRFDDDEPMDATESLTVCRTPKSAVSVDSFSPVGATPSHLFTERPNPGKVEVHFGDVKAIDWTTEGRRNFEVALVQPCGDLVPVLDKSYQFMNQTIRSIQEAFSYRASYLIEQMRKAFMEIDGQSQDGGGGRQEGMINVFGVLYNGDESERPTRLVRDKVCLKDPKSGKSIAVDMSALSDYSLFPGEVVGFNGKMIGDKLMAEKLFAGVTPPLATFDWNKIAGVPDRLSIIVASGPFTLIDGFGYEPLVALLNYVQKHRPHVLILTGPILSANRDDLLSLSMTCQEFFEHVVSRIADTCSGSGTQLIVVASADDATLCPCYPTPPIRMAQPFDKMQPVFAPDPCLLRVGGLMFGVTSTDVLFHLSSEEMKGPATDGGGDRMSRLVRHLLLQQTFYPLCPPPVDVSIDLEHVNTYAKLPVSPHVLILPSVLRYFLKDIGNVLAVNPGFLTKGRGGGTFCRLEFDRRKLADKSGDVLRCLSGQVVRI